MSYGFANNLRDALPKASFIGLTGTPIEQADANTRAVLGIGGDGCVAVALLSDEMLFPPRLQVLCGSEGSKTGCRHQSGRDEGERVTERGIHGGMFGLIRPRWHFKNCESGNGHRMGPASVPGESADFLRHGECAVKLAQSDLVFTGDGEQLMPCQ